LYYSKDENNTTKKAGDKLYMSLMKKIKLEGMNDLSKELLDLIEIGGSAQAAFDSHFEVRSKNNRINNDKNKWIEMNKIEMADEIKVEKQSQILDFR